ncbi:MAG: hypothetical protein JWN75_745 [Candidatus Saccharibacteria bacterium]|nr:hypothetical protein [Candidatus Saccharibacteria bacterium]
MSDIDFDELDKAVNSLMGKAVSTEPDDIVKAKTLTISSTLKPGEKPVYDKLGEVAKGIGSETLLTEGERTVMSDSKLPTTELASAELESITSNQNVAADTVPAPSVPSMAPAVKRPSSGRAMDVVRSLPTKRAAQTMPSLVAPSRLSAEAPVVPQPESNESEEAGPVAAAENTAPQRLTPFLPDTKVEKRPLGDPTTPTGALESPFTGEKFEEIVQPEAPKDEDIVSSEKNEVKDDSQRPLDATAIEAEPSPEEQKLQEVESAEVVTDPSTAESVRAVESGDTEKLSTGSISQQYQTQPAETPETAGAIYDVKDYHQALGHPAKQKSGWGVVLLIAVIIIACAVIGAAVYFVLGAGL